MSNIVWKVINQYNNYSVSNTGFIKNNITQRILKSCKNDNKKAGNIKWYFMSNS